MRIKILLTLSIIMIASSSVFGQTATPPPRPAATAAPPGPMPKMKVAIIDIMAFREQVGELKAKYDKLQTEFAPRYQQLESLQTKLAAQEKTLAENKTLTPAQAAKLTDEFEQGKKEYERTLEDSQTLARKREQEETEVIYDKLSKFLDQYCAKNGITHVFDARRLQDTNLVVYAAPPANITGDFVKEYNKAYPSGAAKP